MNIRKLFAPSMILYVASVVILNLGFTYVPLIPTELGVLSPMAVVAGAVFVIRDFAQRSSGHYVLLAMILAGLISYWLADPFVAIASVLAFGASELIDWALYSLTKRPFHQRVLISSLLSTPVDTAVFLLGINVFTVGTFILMFLSKMIAAGVIWYAYRKERVPVDTHGHAFT